MKVIEPHIHMIARTTQDYERMARMHTVACCEPAFWAGYDRTSARAFHDYFTHITKFEPTRAAQYQIQHYAWICINPKEADDLALAREVIAFIPEFLDKPTVLGIGEIGLNRNTKNEMTVFQEQVELALARNELIWIHTPHLKDKLRGTRMMIDYLKGRGGVDPERVCFDHAEEHTLGMIRDAGFWAAMTIYPITKNSPPPKRGKRSSAPSGTPCARSGTPSSWPPRTRRMSATPCAPSWATWPCSAKPCWAPNPAWNTWPTG